MRSGKDAASERLLPRLQALRGDGTGETVPFLVDGVAASAEPSGRGLRLCCELMRQAPEDDGELRALMARYLPYADHGAEILCVDKTGRLMLIAPIGPEDDLRAVFRSFCDAAVFWAGVVTGSRPVSRPERMPATMIFP